MRAVVPGKGWVSAAGSQLDFVHYGILGPFAEGDYLRRVTVMITADGACGGRFAATLGPSGEATNAAFVRGMPLIQRSLETWQTIPDLFWYAVAGVPLWFHLPVGIVGSVGSRYVVWFWSASTAEVAKTVLVGAEVLRFGKESRE